MGRILKYILIAAGALVALLIVAAVLFMALFDPNDFRDDVADACFRGSRSRSAKRGSATHRGSATSPS